MSAQVRIPVATQDEAPVVVSYAEAEAGTARTLGVRSWNGNLYAPYLPFSGQREVSIAGDKHFPAVVTDTYHWRGTHAATDEEWAALKQSDYRNYLIIETPASDSPGPREVRREVWQRCGEPRYAVMTFGMGHNHGGTDVMIADGDNTNLAPDSYYRADDFEAARAAAIEVALYRGDDRSVTSLRTRPAPLIVHDASVLRLVTATRETQEVVNARGYYRAAANDLAHLLTGSRRGLDEELHDIATEQQAWERLTQAREALVALTDDIPGYGAQRRPFEQGRDPLF